MASNIDDIEKRFLQMLEDGHHIFDLAAAGFVGGTDPEVIRSDLFNTDQRIDETERELRRMLVVHATVHGATSVPRTLVLMALARDAERIGDHAKNLFALCVAGPNLGDEKEALTELKDRVSAMLTRARDVHVSQDENEAHAFLADLEKVEEVCDDGVKRLLKIEGSNAASAALGYRYFKRVVSHAGNIVTALVVPLDKLDYLDEG